MPARRACWLTDIRARFGAALREWRTRQQLTQEQLAERSALSSKFIGEVERGAGNPTIETIARIADALDIRVSDLFESLDRDAGTAYRLSRRDVQVVREAAASIDSLLEQIDSAPYRIKSRRKKS